MIKITKARKRGVITALFVLPFFLAGAGWAGFSGYWSLAFWILVAWGSFFFLLTSYLFVAFVIFLASIYTFFQGYWLIGIGGLLLTGYLFFASKLTDKDIGNLLQRTRAISPNAADAFEKFMDSRNQWRLIIIIFVISALLTILIFWLEK